jgi:hypothetical protein
MKQENGSPSCRKCKHYRPFGHGYTCLAGSWYMIGEPPLLRPECVKYTPKLRAEKE